MMFTYVWVDSADKYRCALLWNLNGWVHKWNCSTRCIFYYFCLVVVVVFSQLWGKCRLLFIFWQDLCSEPQRGGFLICDVIKIYCLELQHGHELNPSHSLDVCRGFHTHKWASLCRSSELWVMSCELWVMSYGAGICTIISRKSSWVLFPFLRVVVVLRGVRLHRVITVVRGGDNDNERQKTKPSG